MHRSILLSALVCVALAGCASVTPSATERGVLIEALRPLPPDTWPARTDAGDPIPEPAPDSAVTFARFGALHGGYLYELVERGASDRPTGGLAAPRQLLFLSRPVPAEERIEPRAAFTVHPRRGEPGSPVKVDTPGVWTFAYVHTPARDEPRGLAVLLTGVGFLSDPERDTARALVSRGWMVAIVTPSANVYGKAVILATAGTPEAAESDRVREAVLPRLVDEALSERAYAAAAVRDALLREHPELAHKPTVLAGFSLGAIALPAVAARLDGPVDAAVFVGGGTDLPRVLLSTELGQERVIMLADATDAQGTPLLVAPTHEQRELAADRALERSALDPEHLAPRLAGVPVLMLHASRDEIVPAALGERLWERLGRPERWTYPVGHTALFLLVGQQTAAIADWIERAVAQDPG